MDMSQISRSLKIVAGPSMTASARYNATARKRKSRMRRGWMSVNVLGLSCAGVVLGSWLHAQAAGHSEWQRPSLPSDAHNGNVATPDTAAQNIGSNALSASSAARTGESTPPAAAVNGNAGDVSSSNASATVTTTTAAPDLNTARLVVPDADQVERLAPDHLPINSAMSDDIIKVRVAVIRAKVTAYTPMDHLHTKPDWADGIVAWHPNRKKRRVAQHPYGLATDWQQFPGGATFIRVPGYMEKALPVFPKTSALLMMPVANRAKHDAKASNRSSTFATSRHIPHFASGALAN